MMYRWRFVVVLLLGLLGAATHRTVCGGPDSSEADVDLEALLLEMIDLTRLTYSLNPPYTTHEASSHDPLSDPPCVVGERCWFANYDCGNFLRTEVNQGRTEYVMLDEDGPGAVERIWTPNPSGTLRVYIDHASEPAIEAPMNSLLSGGVPPFRQPLGHFFSPGTWNLYFPIPHATHCKITTDLDQIPGSLPMFYQVFHRSYGPSTTVESFTMAGAEALDPLIQSVAAVLSEPSLVYEPSPDHQAFTGWLAVNGDPLVIPATAVAGPAAAIREFRLQPAQLDERALRETLLTISFDGVTNVQAPLGDFFGTGPGWNPYESMPFEVRSDGWFVSRWAMPFQDSASIRLRRASPDPAGASYVVKVEPYEWSPESLYFHAGWRADYAVYEHGDQDWNFITIQGSGNYVGNMLNVANPFLAWWGEGDEKTFVDGETFPSYFGTGSEDYYGFGWASTTLSSHAYHNLTRADGEPGVNFGRASMNRWNIWDPVVFGQQLDVNLGRTIFFPTSAERRPLYDVVNYWYGAPGSTDNLPQLTLQDLVIPEIPPVEEKPMPGLVFEGEEMSITATAGVARQRMIMQPWEVGGQLWSRHFQNWWGWGGIGDTARYEFELAEEGSYCVGVYLTRGPEYAIFGLDVNDQPAGGTIDLWAGEGPVPAEGIALDSLQLPAGPNTLTAEVVDVNPASEYGPYHYFGFDALVLIRSDLANASTLTVGREELSWSPFSALRYELVRGDLAQLLATGGDYSQSVSECLADDHPATFLAYDADPLPGQGYWFLLRGEACEPGTFDSGGAGQAAPRDPGIDGSPDTCP